jgi:hypothetical protein
MEIWHTWIGYLGLIAGLVAAAYFGWSALRSALIGFVGGLVLVTAINVVAPPPPACLQSAKGWDILRTWSIKCPDPTKDLLPGAVRK